MKNFVLGVDLGSTSVKAAIVDSQNGDLVQSAFILHNADKSGLPSSWHEQGVTKILRSFASCLKLLSPEFLIRVIGISVTGQQHGIMFWRNSLITQLSSSKKTFEEFLSEEESDAKEYWTDLITWQDQRADKDFLQSLPEQKSSVHSGYGLVSLFWLLRNGHEKMLESYDHAGTVMDFVVAVLCCKQHSIMSYQNAERWGYYCIRTNKWDEDKLISAGIPRRFLPEPIQPGTVVGTMSYPFLTLPTGLKVFVGLGDLQCSVYMALRESVAVLNLGTSSQLLIEVKESELDRVVFPTTVTVVPHMDGSFLGLAASLNGGNVLKAFVQQIAAFYQRVAGLKMEEQQIWDRLLNSQDATVRKLATDLDVKSTLFGERHDTGLKAEVSNLDVTHFQLEIIFGATIRGLFRNLFQMMPIPLLLANNKTTLVATGKAADQPYIHYLKDIIPPEITLELGTTDAAYGAAVIAVKKLGA